jgi:iron complex transport system ATP-binding protein|tara:strand:+ start:325 stop:1152 length:828 start_codon:yes stop_codon:yes gene_type:complete
MNNPTDTSLEKKSPILESRNISFHYTHEKEEAIIDASFQIKQGDFVGAIGPNGSGKSTLLKLAAGILYPSKGEFFYRNQPISGYKKKDFAKLAAWVPQESGMVFPFRTQEVVLMGRYPYQSGFTFETEEDIKVASEVMELTGTKFLLGKKFTEISGGEKQRVLIASALAQKPETLILDEPISFLDIKYQIEILEILRMLNLKHSVTIIIALHDLNLASKYCSRLLLLKKGNIVSEGPPKAILEKSVIESVYETQIKTLIDEEDGSMIILPRTRNN